MTKLQMMRKKAGLTQRELSELSGVSFRTLQYYDQGSKSLGCARVDKIIKIATVLNCRIEDIIDESNILESIKDYYKEKNISDKNI